MKIKTLKLQRGGATLPYQSVKYYYGTDFLTPDQLMGIPPTGMVLELQPVEEALKKKKKKDSKDDFKLLSKEVINDLMQHGLPNEVETFLDNLYKYEQSNNRLFTASTNRNQYYLLAKMASNMLYNKELYKKTLDHVEKQDSLSEYVTSSNGGMYVRNTRNGKIDVVSFKDFEKNRKKYKALSVQDLMEARAYDPNTIFNKGIDIFSDVRETVGTSKIADNIMDIVKQLGGDTIDRTNYITASQAQGILLKQLTKDERESMQQLNNLYEQFGSDAIFKLKNKSKGFSAYEKALEYIYSVLPQNQKRLLTANYLIDGGEEKNPTNIIINSLFLGHEREDTEELTFDKSASDYNKESKAPLYTLTPMESFWNGDTNREIVNITDPTYDNKYKISLRGNTLTSLTTDNGNSIQTAPLSLALNANGEGMGKYLDYNNIYYGNKKIHSSFLDKMLYHNATISQVWVPTNGNGSIDFESLSKFAEVELELQKEGILDLPRGAEKQIAINTRLAQEGLNIRVDLDGNFTSSSNMEKFFLTYAYAQNEDLEEDNFYVKKILGDEEDLMEDMIEEIFEKYDLDDPTGSGDMIIAPLFIKEKPNAAINARNNAHHGSKFESSTVQDDMLRQNIERGPQNQNEVVLGDASLLNMQ